MKLQSEILVTKSEAEGIILEQLANGLKYFEKYYQNLSMHYSGIDFSHFETLKDFCFTQHFKFKNDSLYFDLKVFFVIYKDLRFLENIYIKKLGLPASLYLEFLRLHQRKIDRLIQLVFEEIYTEECLASIGSSKTCRTQITGTAE
jgi:hypothetical protein